MLRVRSVSYTHLTSIADENGKLTPVTAKNSYVTAGGKWYYVDKSSYPLKGEQVIDYVLSLIHI